MTWHLLLGGSLMFCWLRSGCKSCFKIKRRALCLRVILHTPAINDLGKQLAGVELVCLMNPLWEWVTPDRARSRSSSVTASYKISGINRNTIQQPAALLCFAALRRKHPAATRILAAVQLIHHTLHTEISLTIRRLVLPEHGQVVDAHHWPLNGSRASVAWN